MSFIDLALTACVAFVIGLLIGAIGIGGVLLTPWLTQVIGLPVREAIVISSLAFIATGITALIVAARSVRDAGAIEWGLVGATVPGALAGAWALSVIPARAALMVLALLTIAIGYRVLFPRRREAGPEGRPAGRRTTPGILIGFLAGFGSALTGTGGPMVLTPMLLWTGAPMLAAISLGQLVQLPIGLTATAGNLYLGSVDVGAGIAIGLALVPGAFLGARVARTLPLLVLSRIVGVTLIAAGISFAAKALTGS